MSAKAKQQRNTFIAVAIALMLLVVVISVVMFQQGTAANKGSVTGSFLLVTPNGNMTVPASSGNLNPLTITYGSGSSASAINSIQWTVYGTINGVQTSGAWTSSTTQRFEIYQQGITSPISSSTATYPMNGPAWYQTQVLTTYTIPGSSINQVIAGLVTQNGQFTIQLTDTIQVSGSFNGAQQTLTANCVGSLNINYVAATQALTLTASVQISPLQLVSP